MLLLGLASFTALGFATLAGAQMAIFCWKINPRLTVVAALCVVAIVSIVAHDFVDEIGDLEELHRLPIQLF